MVVGKFEPEQAKDTTLKKAIAIGLDEALTALEESFHDLTDEQFWGFALEGRHNIITIVEHCLDAMDLYACEVQVGRQVLEHEKRFDIWNFSPEQVRDRMKDLPPASRALDRLRTLRRAVMGNLESASEQELLEPRVRDNWFWEESKKTSADAYMRTIMHTMAHVRQIWLMRGAMGLTDKDGWPEQHWA